MRTEAQIAAEVRAMPTSKLAQMVGNFDLYRKDAAYAAAGRKHLARKTRQPENTAERMADGMAKLEAIVKAELNRRAKGGAR